MCDTQMYEDYTIGKGESDLVVKGDLTMVEKCGDKVENICPLSPS